MESKQDKAVRALVRWGYLPRASAQRKVAKLSGDHVTALANATRRADVTAVLDAVTDADAEKAQQAAATEPVAAKQPPKQVKSPDAGDTAADTE